MTELVMIGFNHLTASVDVRERCAMSEKGRMALGYQLIASANIHAVVILATCNRLEIYADCANGLLAGQFIADTLQQQFDVPEAVLYQYDGEAVVHHLFRVACGLDSMVLGEAQILGQVSDAYQSAQRMKALTPQLHRLFMSAIQTGKRAHTETAISRYATSVSHVALNLVANAQSVLIIGAGEMATQAAHASHDKHIPHITITTRHYENACALANQVGGQALLWSKLWDFLADVDCVISATSAPHPILTHHDLGDVLSRRDKPLTIVDIAVPRDVEPSARALAGLCLYDMDDIQQVVDDNLRQRQACVPHIEAIIAQEAGIFMTWQRGRAITPTITDLRHKVQRIAKSEMDDLMPKLSHLAADDVQRIEKMVHRLVNKILHEPTLALRQHAQNGGGDDYSRVVRDLFALTGLDERHSRG